MLTTAKTARLSFMLACTSAVGILAGLLPFILSKGAKFPCHCSQVNSYLGYTLHYMWPEAVFVLTN